MSANSKKLRICRSDGLFLDAVGSAHQLLLESWDSDVAAMFAATFLLCCKEAAGQSAIASKQGVTFLCYLLKVIH